MAAHRRTAAKPVRRAAAPCASALPHAASNDRCLPLRRQSPRSRLPREMACPTSGRQSRASQDLERQAMLTRDKMLDDMVDEVFREQGITDQPLPPSREQPPTPEK